LFSIKPTANFKGLGCRNFDSSCHHSLSFRQLPDASFDFDGDRTIGQVDVVFKMLYLILQIINPLPQISYFTEGPFSHNGLNGFLVSVKGVSIFVDGRGVMLQQFPQTHFVDCFFLRHDILLLNYYLISLTHHPFGHIIITGPMMVT